MDVLSLYDGISCGMLAMLAVGVDVGRYVAYETDPDAVSVSRRNFPMVEQRGDVFAADFSDIRDPDFLIGGSPCTYWSSLQHDRRETGPAGRGWTLFQIYLRAIRDARPYWFLYENNVSMPRPVRFAIDRAFGFPAVQIDSALFSAQMRQRLYWIGRRDPDGTYKSVCIPAPLDRHVRLSDVLDSGIVEREKAYALTATYHKTAPRNMFRRRERTMVAEPLRDGEGLPPGAYACPARGGRIEVLGETYATDLPDGSYWFRKLSIAECKRLQTVPEWYDLSGIPRRSAYRCLGNAWTCDVISYLIHCCLFPCRRAGYVQRDLFDRYEEIV